MEKVFYVFMVIFFNGFFIVVKFVFLCLYFSLVWDFLGFVWKKFWSLLFCCWNFRMFCYEECCLWFVSIGCYFVVLGGWVFIFIGNFWLVVVVKSIFIWIVCDLGLWVVVCWGVFFVLDIDVLKFLYFRLVIFVDLL